MFEWREKHYLVTVDSYSGWFEVNQLQNTCAKDIINKLKVHFARFGVPDLLISDPGPQYRSKEFADFAKAWGFKHVQSSPYFHSSNGLAEKAVQSAKKLLEKSLRDKSDFYLNLLNWRNTPRDAILGSQAQRNLSRRTRNTIPTSEALLLPKVQEPGSVHRRLSELRKEQKRHVDPRARPLAPLVPGDKVNIQTKKGYDKPAVVIRQAAEPRSYIVRSDDRGQEYRRNRQHLLKTNITNASVADPIVPLENTQVVTPPAAPEPVSVPSTNELPSVTRTNTTPVQTRSGRNIVPPARFKDFV
jgi:hypothetical protein